MKLRREDHQIVAQPGRRGDQNGLRPELDRRRRDCLGPPEVVVLYEIPRRQAERRLVTAIENRFKLNGELGQAILAQTRHQCWREVSQNLTERNLRGEGEVERGPRI